MSETCGCQCGGNLTLGQAAASAAVDLEALLGELRAAAGAAGASA